MSDRPQLTVERLRSLLTYNPETGDIHWLVTGAGRRLNRLAGSPDRHGYLQTRIDYRMYFNHRLAWMFEHGSFPSGVIDHIDGDPLNNRISNLRDVDRRTNQENQRKAASSNKSTGLLGASLHRQTGKFHAHIQVRGKVISLGLHKTPELAHATYINTKRIMHKRSTI